MALAKDIPCDEPLLETLRLVLDKIPPKELEDYARSTPSFLSGGFRSVKTQLIRARLANMLASSEPVDPRLRAMLRDQVRRSLEAGGGAAAVMRELENARAELASLRGTAAKLAKESSARAAAETKTAHVLEENSALRAERGALRQRVESLEAENRMLREETETRIGVLLQDRLAGEFAAYFNSVAKGCAEGEAAEAAGGESFAARVARAIIKADDAKLAVWRKTLETLIEAGLFTRDEATSLHSALREAFARVHFGGNPATDKGGDADGGTPRGLLRRAMAGKTPAILLIDAHNSLFALQGRYRLPGEHTWPTAQAREWFVSDVALALRESPNVRAYIVFDGPRYSQATKSGNVTVIYSGGEGEHRADGVLVDLAHFLDDSGSSGILIVTNDGELAGLASRHNAGNLAPTDLLPYLL